MRRSDRLFDLVQILRDGRLHRAVDLAQALGGVSVRTIWRDMATLIASGMPIEGERGVGYILRVPTTLPPLMLTPLEIEVLRRGIRLMAEDADPARARAARSLAAKIAAVAPGPVDAGVEDIFTFAVGGATPAEAHLPILRAAIRSDTILEMVFLDAHDREVRETVRALRLMTVDDRRCLICAVDGKDDAQRVWLDRILSLGV